MLDLKHLIETAATRCEDVFFPLTDWSYADWMTALAGEVGEAANEIKKWRRGDYHGAESVFKSRVAAELADVVLYTVMLAKRLDIDLERAIIDKFNEVSEKRGSKIRLGPFVQDVVVG